MSALLLAGALVGCSAADAPGTASGGTCGDGVIGGAESCDDGNTASRDGCTDLCEVSPGFVCEGEPSVCTVEGGSDPVCGDGALDIGEGCDDGGTVSGDGCTDACAREQGFDCVGEPSVCTPIGTVDPVCGDGVIDAGEACDDGGVAAGDGCSNLCGVEDGYTCAGEPSVCAPIGTVDPVCGDGVVDVGETCDDGGAVSGDGCSDACAVENGFTCEGAPSACTPIGTVDPVCGDGSVDDGEACDDGGTLVGDGCSNLCTVEPGYTCEGSPSTCLPGVGLCVGVVCSDDPCMREACNADTGLCEVVEELAEGARCNDGSLCTAFDTCTSGVCVGQPLQCPGEGGPCGGVSCNPSTGACEARGDVPDGTPCDTDTNLCTSEVCAAGACVMSTAADCTPCGTDDYCGGGVCGGVPPELLLGFDGSVPAGFTMGGAAPWLIDGGAGRSGGALRSGDIGDSQNSTATYSFTASAAGTGSFWYRVESETCCDDLTVTLDGATIVDGATTGTWTEAAFTFGAGAHTLVFTYAKDSSLSTGGDSAWIDDLRLPGGTSCADFACGIAVSNGTECITCEAFEDGATCDDVPGDCMTAICTDGACLPVPIEDGASCDADPNDCREQVCNAGACVDATVYDDCAACGADGSGLCAGGNCGGVESGTGWSFDDGVVPAEFASPGDVAWRLDSTRAHSGGWSARSGSTGDNQISVAEVEVTLATAGEVRFFYQMESEGCCDDFFFYVDFEVAFEDAGTIGSWTEVVIPLSAGAHTLAWVYDKDGSFSTGYDGVFVDTITVSGTDRCGTGDACGVEVFDGTACIACPLLDDGASCDSDPVDCLVEVCGGGRCVASGVESCTPCGDGTDYCVGGECGGVPEETNFRFGAGAGIPAGFTMSGDQPWLLEAGSGRSGGALRSGDIGDNGESIATYNFSIARPGSLSFWYSVSSEPSYDFFTATLDGTEIARGAGTIDWTEVTRPLTAGAHALVFRFYKDGSSSVGADAAFVDDMTITGNDSCTGDTECSPELFDGAGCVACAVPDGTTCADGVCGAGVCAAP